MGALDILVIGAVVVIGGYFLIQNMGQTALARASVNCQNPKYANTQACGLVKFAVGPTPTHHGGDIKVTIA